MGQSVKRRAILETAEALFYSHGFHAIGLKRILGEPNAATTTMYNHFSSKERLIEDVLKKREGEYWSYLDSLVQNKSDPPLLQVVKAHAKWLGDKGKDGCMFLRAIEEFAGTDYQIGNIAAAHKNRLLQYLRNLVRDNGHKFV